MSAWDSMCRPRSASAALPPSPSAHSVSARTVGGGEEGLLQLPSASRRPALAAFRGQARSASGGSSARHPRGAGAVLHQQRTAHHHGGLEARHVQQAGHVGTGARVASHMADAQVAHAALLQPLLCAAGRVRRAASAVAQACDA